MTEALGSGQKRFNQRLLAEHCVSEKKARTMFQVLQAQDLDMGGDTLEESLASSNRQLELCGLEIVAVSVDGLRFFSIINKHADDIAKTATRLSSNEVNFCRLVLEHLVAEGPSSRATLINLRTHLKGDAANSFKLDTAEACLEKMVEEKWIAETKRDDTAGGPKPRRGSMQANLTLAPRSYMELSYMLMDQFGMDKADLPQQLYFR